MIAEDDVKALAVEVIEELKMLLSQRADALTLEYSYRKVEKILRRWAEARQARQRVISSGKVK